MWDSVMDKSGAEAGFLRELLFPLPIFIPPISSQSPSPITWCWYNRPVSGRSTQSPTALIKKLAGSAYAELHGSGKWCTIWSHLLIERAVPPNHAISILCFIFQNVSWVIAINMNTLQLLNQHLCARNFIALLAACYDHRHRKNRAYRNFPVRWSLKSSILSLLSPHYSYVLRLIPWLFWTR
jgi:hypothetical protein